MRWSPFALAAALLAGCATPPPPTAPELRERRTGRATLCENPRGLGHLRAGAGSVLPMTVSDDGWCARAFSYGGHGHTSGSIVEQPRHGQARVRLLPERTLVEYRSDPGYAGPDRFSATVTPGNAVHVIEVTVQR